MATLKKWRLLLVAMVMLQMVQAQQNNTPYNEQHRPQLHFSPKKGWMNDPNGMVYLNGKYHLFYQYHPHSTVWGPMHWGHATSTDLMRWEEQPIALYPDALGTIFSGSAVIDKNNTAGFGANAMVAIYTNHSHAMEKEGFEKIETQGVAYSLDEGKTWTKYKGNPVLPNPGIRDFRDPKVMWHEPTKKWIMTLATMDRITFYSSPDLKNWARESDFGKDLGAHGGVWECPDLFPLQHEGKQVWVLIVNLNPGGPNGGSATQYFTGSFDGNNFIPDDNQTKWLDYGPDEYAGITWSNTGDRKIFLGWMSNWSYANVVPTGNWRSTCTIARELALTWQDNRYLVTSVPVKEIEQLSTKSFTASNIKVKNYLLTAKTGVLNSPAMLKISADDLKSFAITLSNNAGEKLIVGFDKSSNEYYVDRTRSGKTAFHNDFAKKAVTRRVAATKGANLTLVIDNSSVELFADNGLSVMTAIFFPESNYTTITVTSNEGFIIKNLRFDQLKSIWQ